MENTDPKKLANLNSYMIKVAEKLGIEHANTVLLDLAVSKNPNQIFHLAHPVLKRRRLIDQNYWKVVNRWGGGYPRPYAEFIY